MVAQKGLERRRRTTELPGIAAVAVALVPIGGLAHHVTVLWARQGIAAHHGLCPQPDVPDRAAYGPISEISQASA